MRNHAGDYRGFYIHSEAWFAKDGDAQEVVFGLYCQDGGTSGEMMMEWIDLDVGELVPKLSIFSDAWSSASQFLDLFLKLGEVDSKNITPAEFVEILKSCGFKDMTKRERSS